MPRRPPRGSARSLAAEDHRAPAPSALGRGGARRDPHHRRRRHPALRGVAAVDRRPDLRRGAQRAEAQSLSEQWQADYENSATASPSRPRLPRRRPLPLRRPRTPSSCAQPADAQIFGTVHIPRFGSDYAVPVAGGVTRAHTLDPIGIGHYPGTQMPGASATSRSRRTGRRTASRSTDSPISTSTTRS